MAPNTWPGVILVFGKKNPVMLVKAVVTRNSSVQPGRRRAAYIPPSTMNPEMIAITLMTVWSSVKSPIDMPKII
jgi:hypothetical protein